MQKKKKKVLIWSVWFISLAVITYSPLVVQYDVINPFILGIPFTLFWWLLLTFILMISVIIFSHTIKRELS